MAIEHCMDCIHSTAKDEVMWQAFPVPWFGNIVSKQVAVATVGLNPSWSEFVTVKKSWRDSKERLPVLQDMDKKNRGEISGEQANQIAAARENYFAPNERSPHPWFNVLQGVMSAGNLNCSYANGTAVHLDLVACATWHEWSKIHDEAKNVLVSKCFPKFADTLSKLSSNVLLLLDGRTVFETIRTRCDALVNIREVVGEVPSLEVWRGKLSAEFSGHDFLAWSNPVNRQTNQMPLVDWLRRQVR
jgi:hypothetical protein